MATILEDIKIIVVDSSAKDMLREIDEDQHSEKQLKFIQSLKGSIQEYEGLEQTEWS